MTFLNSCILLGRYRDVTIIDDKLSCLILVINDNDGDITIPVFIGTEVAKQILKSCNPHDLIGIKGKIDADENGLIIKAIKITFLSTQKRAD